MVRLNRQFRYDVRRALPKEAVGLGAGLFALSVSVLLFACGPADEDAGTKADRATEPQFGGTAVLCVPSQAKGLNPFVTSEQRAWDLRPLLFTPLVRRDTSQRLVPYLARSWEWGDNRQRLAFQLRQDVTWHDDTRVSARDVAWTLEAASRPEFYSQASDFASLDSVTVEDSLSVVAHFSERFFAGLEPFTDVPILPRHLLEGRSAQAFNSASYHQEPVGSGPFRFIQRRPDGSLVFERFEDFPQKLGPVYLDRLVVRVIPAARTMVTEFRVGQVDACVTTSSGAAQLQKVDELRIDALQPATVQYVALNTHVSPFDDARVRRALSAALDRSAIANIVSPLASPAGTPLSRESPWRAPGLTQPDDNPQLADSLLTAAGWTRPTDGVRQTSGGERLAFTLTAPTQGRDALTVMQAQLEEVGADVELRFMEWTAYINRIMNPDTRPAAMALGLGTESLRRPDYRATFHSESSDNLSGYGSPRLDSLLAAAATARGSTRLQSTYRGIQRILSREVPYIFTVYVPRGLAVGPRLRGVDPALNTPLATVAHWWIPADRRR